MVLGTADEAGLPWVTPVWFAPNGYREFLWVSDPERRHSWNLAVRPQVSIVIFDSTVPIGTGQAVYRAVASDHFVLGEQDERLPVSPSSLP
jgi:nitroimidazol reductase NimA-like FMN-containing flavoprotein (pyridoxamine 5'-phosphate oxidase superfamily)